MITGTSTDYTGRKVDLALFPEIATPGIPADARLTNQPKAVAGLSAVVQNYGRILLTRLGTFRADPFMGSLFVDKITTRLVRFPSDIQQTFMIESDKVLEYMDEKVTDETPLDEQIKRASLVDQELSVTSVDLTIEIESRSGDKVSFLLPVNWNS